MNRTLLVEEGSISNDVVKLTKSLARNIMYRIEKSSKYYSKNGNYVLSRGIINFDTESLIKDMKMIKVKYCVYFFDKERDREYFMKYNDSIAFGSHCDYNKGEMKLSLCYVNESPDDMFYPTIQHEMNHMYQNANGQLKDEELYKRVEYWKENGDGNTQWIAYAIYLAFNTEISSFASQYYAYLVQNKIPKSLSGKDYAIDKNNPYFDFDRAYSVVEDIDIDEDELKDKFGISVRRLYGILNNAEKKYQEKMMRVWNRYVNEGKHLAHDPFRMNFIFECYSKGIRESTDEYEL